MRSVFPGGEIAVLGGLVHPSRDRGGLHPQEGSVPVRSQSFDRFEGKGASLHDPFLSLPPKPHGPLSEVHVVGSDPRELRSSRRQSVAQDERPCPPRSSPSSRG